jgi:sulfur-oxidizing protein SoxA
VVAEARRGGEHLRLLPRRRAPVDARRGGRYPKHSPALGRVANLEERINACVRDNQKAEPLAWESPELLALTPIVARQSAGCRSRCRSRASAKATYERGRRSTTSARASCTCRARNATTALGPHAARGEDQPGHPADWPAYRLEWQSLGSLQRRLRACYFGVRAELPAFGSPDLVALELYLADRARADLADRAARRQEDRLASEAPLLLPSPRP